MRMQSEALLQSYITYAVMLHAGPGALLQSAVIMTWRLIREFQAPTCIAVPDSVTDTDQGPASVYGLHSRVPSMRLIRALLRSTLGDSLATFRADRRLVPQSRSLAFRTAEFCCVCIACAIWADPLQSTWGVPGDSMQTSQGPTYLSPRPLSRPRQSSLTFMQMQSGPC